MRGKTRTLFRGLIPRRFRRDLAVVPVVRLTGVVGMNAPLRPGLSLASVAKPLDRAFAVPDAKAVALIINSPGGSAVQSHLVFRRIRTLAEENGVRVLAFIEDVGASGGYMIACAADEIFADPSSVVGSIGVVGGSFGFHKLIEKIGVERRLYTSGENKAMLDPFLPEKPEDVERLKEIQRDIHADFIALVKSRRGAHLHAPDETLFSGAYWAGRTALAYGLIDGLGDLRSVLKQRFGEDVEMPLMPAERGLFGRRQPGIAGALWSGGQPGGVAAEVLAAYEARSLWGRFGL